MNNSDKCTEVQVKRFKAIKDASFKLSSLNVLVGANNSGKSSIIQGLHFGIGLLQTIRLSGKWTTGDTIGTSINPTELIYSPSGGRLLSGDGRQASNKCRICHRVAVHSCFRGTTRRRHPKGPQSEHCCQGDYGYCSQETFESRYTPSVSFRQDWRVYPRPNNTSPMEYCFGLSPEATQIWCCETSCCACGARQSGRASSLTSGKFSQT